MSPRRRSAGARAPGEPPPAAGAAVGPASPRAEGRRREGGEAFLDARLLARSLRPADLDDLAWFGVRGALVPFTGGAALGPARAAKAVRAGWDELAGPVHRRLRRAGIAGALALGVHPARVPFRGLEALLHDLPEQLGRPGVAAIGELGLAAGGRREEELLDRQLALAAELRLPVVASAHGEGGALPAGGPGARGSGAGRAGDALLRRLLAILRASEVPPERLLVAVGPGPAAFRLVRACGFAACVSLSAGGGALDAAVRLVRANGPEGLLLASGAGEAGGDLLALPRAAGRLRMAGLSAAVIRRVCGGNAARLLGGAGGWPSIG